MPDTCQNFIKLVSIWADFQKFTKLVYVTTPGASDSTKKMNTFEANLTHVGLCILIQEGGADDWSFLLLTSPVAMGYTTRGWTAVADRKSVV